jgi:antimicrobial peptide system SdpA family protein
MWLPQRNFIQDAVPEGWAFFTRNPREENIIAYKIQNDKIGNKVQLINNQLNLLFGANREARSKNSKLTILASRFKEEEWADVNFLDTDSIDLTAFEFKEVSVKGPFFFGKFLVRRFEPEPWSLFSISGIREKSKSKIILLNITEIDDSE